MMSTIQELVRAHLRKSDKMKYFEVVNNVNWIAAGIKLGYLVDYPISDMETFLDGLQKVKSARLKEKRL